MIYLFHFLRWGKKFLRFPAQFFSLLIRDFKYDYFPLENNKNQFVFVIGLPKSGTTLIEEILYELGYVDLTNSFLRIYNNKNLKHPHDISEKMFKSVPKNKKTFLKTHTHFSKESIEIIKKYNPKVIISTRNLKDMLISRYCHLLASPSRDALKKYINLDITKGFKQFITHENKADDDFVIKYGDKVKGKIVDFYYNWIKEWKEEIKKNNLDHLLLDWESFLQDKKKYIKNIINYLEIKKHTDEQILDTIEKNLLKIKNNDLMSNLKNNIKPKTFNKDSGEIKKILNNDEINNFIQDSLSK